MARIALVSVPFFSHVEATMRLGEALARYDHEVIMWGPERCRDRVTGWSGAFEPYDPEMPRVAGMGFAAELTARTERYAEELIAQLFAHDVDLLVHDSKAPWAQVAGTFLGIQRIVSFPLFPIVTQYRMPSDPGLNWPVPDPEEATARYGDSWRTIARRWGVEMKPFDYVPAETTVTLTTERILGEPTLPPTWHCIGPLMGPPPLLTAPRRARPLVYACFGTSYNRRPALFRAVIDALADEPVDVLVSAGNGIVSPADVGPLPPNVIWREFVPAREVLAQASVHITHGGCNSVHESLLAGVPMVCVPQAFDQFPLSHRLELLGAGLVAEEDPGAIREAVRSLREAGKGRACAQALQEHLLDYDGERRLAELVERALAEDASLTA